MAFERLDRSAVLIAGPTASGKSALALRIAEATGGVVVNADSMQVYEGLPILSAQPSQGEFARAPHCLYGHVSPERDYSVGAWARDVAPLLADRRAEGRLAIVVGGTGLYFRALLGGLDDMPAIPEEVRATVRARMAEEGPAVLHAELARLDPEAARRIRPGDPQRISRALELVAATGRPLADVQTGRGVPLLDGQEAVKIVLTPPRVLLRERIARRFAAMLEAGAVDEVRAFRARFGAVTGTAAKAIGLSEIGAYLNGATTLQEAAERAITRSRQYAKRQDTWFRHQLADDWLRLEDVDDTAPVDRLLPPSP